MPPGGPEIVAGNTTAYRNFLAFHHFWIVLAFLWREKPERLVEAGQFERGDCGRASWFFDLAVDRFRRAKGFTLKYRSSIPVAVPIIIVLLHGCKYNH